MDRDTKEEVFADFATPRPMHVTESKDDHFTVYSQSILEHEEEKQMVRLIQQYLCDHGY